MNGNWTGSLDRPGVSAMSVFPESTPTEVTSLLASASRVSPLRIIRALQLDLAIRCPETAAHGRRISRLAGRLAAALGSPRLDLARLRHAAGLHDIGKVALPDKVLRKPGQFTVKERRQMRRHPEMGAAILSLAATQQMDLAAEVALAHHERWDGKGYPDGLVAGEIPLAARIVAVVDVYDALRQARVYRPEVPEGAVLSMLREGAGKQFDPVVVECFLDTIRSPDEGRGLHPMSDV